MKIVVAVFAACLGAAISVSAAKADSLTENFFDLGNNTSYGTVTLNLAANGTIDGSLKMAGRINQFGMNSTQEYNFNSFSNPFAYNAHPDPSTEPNGPFLSNFLSGKASSQYTFNFGETGEFTSVRQALGGAGDFDFEVFGILYPYPIYFYAAERLQPPPVSAAPEPSSWALMLSGVAMIGLMLRQGRRKRHMVLAA